MTLHGARIWLVTRGGDRVPFYQASLVETLRAAEAQSVDVLDFGALFKTAALDLHNRATAWFEEAAGRIIKGLRINRLLSRDREEQGSGAEGTEQPESLVEQVPDLVIVDDPSITRLLRLLPGYREQVVPTIALIDDFSVNTRWRNAEVHAYVIPHDSLRGPHIAQDSSALVRIAGPPVSTRYQSERKTLDARTALNLDLGAPALVIAVAGMDDGLLDKVVFQMTLFDLKPTILFDHANDPRKARVLREAATNYGLAAKMFGEVDDLSVYYAAADLVLLGAADPRVLDVLLSARPVVLVGREQGAARTPFLADQGALIWFEDVLELSTRIEGLLPPKTNSTVAQRALQLLSADSLEQVVAAFADLYDQRQTLIEREPIEEPPTQPPVGTDQPPTSEIALKHSIFEEIGQPPPSQATEAPLKPLTAAEAKDQMAGLILKEREAERSLAEAVRARDKWLERHELAKEFQEQQLIDTAKSKLDDYRQTVMAFNAQLETIQRAKLKLKERVKKPSSTPHSPELGSSDTRSEREALDVEQRFRKIELERDLARLRRKIRDEGER